MTAPQALVSVCDGLQTAGVSCESLLSVRGRNQGGPQPSGDEGIWRCLPLIKLSKVEVIDDHSRDRTPGSPMLCGEPGVNAHDDPGGDPQNGHAVVAAAIGARSR
jgi:hypothetical protein